jgi:hypothetical protein
MAAVTAREIDVLCLRDSIEYSSLRLGLKLFIIPLAVPDRNPKIDQLPRPHSNTNPALVTDFPPERDTEDLVHWEYWERMEKVPEYWEMVEKEWWRDFWT